MSTPFAHRLPAGYLNTELETCKGIKSTILEENLQESQHQRQNIIPMSDDINPNKSSKQGKKEKEGYWGNVIPVLINKSTHVPLLTITKKFIKPYMLNILIIFLICFGVPLALKSYFFDMQCHRPHESEENGGSLVGLEQSEEHCSSHLNQYLVVYCWAWLVYEFIFLTAVTFSNPGYTRSPQQCPSGRVNICQICYCSVDNLVFHCDICDLCCEGFSHHCLWVGKCIGSGNKILLNGYVWGYPIGTIFMVGILFWMKH